MEPSPPNSGSTISSRAALAAAGETVTNVFVLGAAFGLSHLAFQWQPWLGWVLWTPLALVVTFDLLKTVVSAGMGVVLFFSRSKLDAARRADQPKLLLADGIVLLSNLLLAFIAYLAVRSQI
jgi:hypothetical protein